MVESDVQFAAQILKHEAQIFARTGRNDIEWVENTIVTDPMGRTSSITPGAPTIIIGDIQATTADDRNKMEQGIVQTGDLKLFTDFDVANNLVELTPLDTIKVDGNVYQVITKMEETIIGKVKVHNSYLLRERP